MLPASNSPRCDAEPRPINLTLPPLPLPPFSAPAPSPPAVQADHGLPLRLPRQRHHDPAHGPRHNFPDAPVQHRPSAPAAGPGANPKYPDIGKADCVGGRSAAQCSANGWGQPRCCGSFARPPLLPGVCTCQHQPPLVSDSLKGGAKLFHCRPFCQTLAAQVCAQLCLSTCGHASSCVCGMPLHLSRPAPLCTHSLTHLLRWFFVALVPACSHDGGRPSGAHHR